MNRAPKFVKVLESFREFMVRNGLIDAVTGQKLQRFTWYVLVIACIVHH